MTTCTTWHVRIDLVGEEDDELSARVKLVGAPLVAECPLHTSPDPDCSTCRDLRAYTAWQDLTDVVQSLVEVLEREHRVRSVHPAPPGAA